MLLVTNYTQPRLAQPEEGASFGWGTQAFAVAAVTAAIFCVPRFVIETVIAEVQDTAILQPVAKHDGFNDALHGHIDDQNASMTLVLGNCVLNYVVATGNDLYKGSEHADLTLYSVSSDSIQVNSGRSFASGGDPQMYLFKNASDFKQLAWKYEC